jgi:hypothetical protein
MMFRQFFSNPQAIISIGLGIIPVLFSLLFWLIPCIRFFKLKRDNDRIKMENFRKVAIRSIVNNPLHIKPGDLQFQKTESKPDPRYNAPEKILKEMSVYSMPDIEMEGTVPVYSFPGLEMEAQALKKYREELSTEHLGATVFDTDKRL